MPINKEGLKKNASPRDTFQFKDGDNIIRVLPPCKKYFTDDIDFFDYRMLVHYNIGPEGAPPIPCPRTDDKAARCPICEVARRLRRNPATKELASTLNARTRFVFNVIDIQNPGRGIQVAEVGPSVHDPIFDVIVDPDFGEVLDLKIGRNFKVSMTPSSRSKSGFNSYSVRPGANASSVKEILPKDWAKKIGLLVDRVKTAPDFEELNRLVIAATGGEGAGDAVTKAPTHATTSSAPAGAEEFMDESAGDSVVKQGSSGSPKDDAPAGAEESSIFRCRPHIPSARRPI